METFEIFLFTSLIVSSIWLIFVVISISNENAKLKERLRNEPESTYNVWLRALSNNLPMILDNQHGKETKGKKCPWYFEDIAKKMSFKLSDLKPTEKDVALSIQKQFFDLQKDDLNGYINALKEKNKRQSTEFEAKEQMYVEKIRHLEKEVLYQKRRVEDFEKRFYKEINKESKDEQKILLFMTKEEEYILDSIEQIIEKIKSNKKSK